MAKIRVYELARDLKIESKLLMNTLKTIGVSVASHQSTLDPNDVEKLKKAISGESAAAPKAKPTTQRKVIRRRRKAETPEAEEKTAEAAPAAEAATPAEQPSTGEAVQAAPTEVTESTSVEAKSPEPATQPREPAKPVEKVAVPERKKVRREAGATIVRKATPEEIEQSKSDREAKRRNRKEDSKGTKYTGIGSAEPAAPAAAPAASAPPPEEEGQAKAGRSKGGKDRRSEKTDEQAAKRTVAAKTKRGAVNTRILLNQVDPGEDGEELIETPYGPAQKSVYTPNIAQRRRDLKRRKDLKKTEVTVARASYRVVEMEDEIQVGEFARQLKVKAADIIKKLMDQGVMVTVNQPIDFDTATLIANEYNYEVKSSKKNIEDFIGPSVDLESATDSRPPIVTVMGHVDHGKTSILDAIRKADVASGEAGGITQHIGAYSVIHGDKKIAFIDTPGHEAFSSMRARGANLTDIVVLVVAADDGVMPQTVEAISHAKAAGVPIIVAINKIDKENKNLDRIYTELTEHGIQSEEWGGDVQFVKVSALQKIGIDSLLDAIILQSEILELKTNAGMAADGVVVEAHLDSGRGAVATIMVKHGTLRTGDFVVAGTETGKVRAMHDHHGKRIEEAGPSTPVELLGLSGVPLAGDAINAAESEKVVKDAASWRAENLGQHQQKSSAQSLEDLLGKMQTADTPELAIIVKADTQGSAEAIEDSLEKLNSERVRNKIVHKGIGGVTESDLTLAEATGAVMIGFNVRAARGLDDQAESRGLLLRYHSVIYDLVDAVKALMAGKLPPIQEEVVIGRAEVRQPISVPKIGTIAGSAVIDGKITRSSSLRLIRDDIVVYNGRIGSLRRFKDDVREVKSGYECGISFENYNDIKEGDVIEAYEIKETQPTL